MALRVTPDRECICAILHNVSHCANPAILITPNEDTIACTPPYALHCTAFQVPSTATDFSIFLVVISCFMYSNPSPDATGVHVGGRHMLHRTRRSNPNSALSGYLSTMLRGKNIRCMEQQVRSRLIPGLSNTYFHTKVGES